jgi:hypothetical protein
MVPSATSISKNNKYYANLTINSNSPKALNLYVNEALIFKRMYDEYQKKISINPTSAFIPELSKRTMELIFAAYFTINSKQTNPSCSLWKLINKLALNASNCKNLLGLCLEYLSSPEM